MSITFHFEGDQQHTRFWDCQCIHYNDQVKRNCLDCKDGSGIVVIEGDAHECNFTAGNAARVLEYIGVKFPEDEYIVTFKPDIEQVRILTNVRGEDYDRCHALAQTIMAALHFKADKIVGA